MTGYNLFFLILFFFLEVAKVFFAKYSLLADSVGACGTWRADFGSSYEFRDLAHVGDSQRLLQC